MKRQTEQRAGRRAGLWLALLTMTTLVPPAVAEPPPKAAGKKPAPAFPSWLANLSANLQRIEAAQMFSAILKDEMGPGKGWFHPSRSRYDWQWLAQRHGTGADKAIRRKDFRGPPEFFDRLDRNRDTVLNAEDFDWSPGSAFARQAGQANQWFRMIDADSNGRLSRAEWEAVFGRGARDKDHLTPDDLREMLFPPAPPPDKKGPPPDFHLFW